MLVYEASRRRSGAHHLGRWLAGLHTGPYFPRAAWSQKSVCPRDLAAAQVLPTGKQTPSVAHISDCSRCFKFHQIAASQSDNCNTPSQSLVLFFNEARSHPFLLGVNLTTMQGFWGAVQGCLNAGPVVAARGTTTESGSRNQTGLGI